MHKTVQSGQFRNEKRGKEKEKKGKGKTKKSGRAKEREKANEEYYEMRSAVTDRFEKKMNHKIKDTE